jgi:outer membrane protein assembly factor BamD
MTRSRAPGMAGARRFMALITMIMAAALVVTGACAGSAPTGKVEYSVSAQQNYERGVKELEEKDWVAAAKYFSFIKARFPYSRYAVLAELRMADAEFGAGHYLQAVDSFKMFIKLHPTHEMVSNGYANFRIGEAYTKMLSDDFWLLPPSHEKDQSATIDAERELRSFLKKYPESPYRKKGADLLQKVALKLARHEWYVANFYWERGRSMGTVLRLRRLIERYPGVGYDGDALWLLGQAYLKVDMPDRARSSWEKLVSEHPEHKRAGDARSALAKLSG